MGNYTDTESAACTSLSTGTPSAWIHKSNGLMVIVKEVSGKTNLHDSTPWNVNCEG